MKDNWFAQHKHFDSVYNRILIIIIVANEIDTLYHFIDASTSKKNLLWKLYVLIEFIRLKDVFKWWKPNRKNGFMCLF